MSEQSVTLVSIACSTCNEVRKIDQFYDGLHRVYWTREPGIYVDHGEARAAIDRLEEREARQGGRSWERIDDD
jgi:hypothetical protein